MQWSCFTGYGLQSRKFKSIVVFISNNVNIKSKKKKIKIGWGDGSAHYCLLGKNKNLRSYPQLPSKRQSWQQMFLPKHWVGEGIREDASQKLIRQPTWSFRDIRFSERTCLPK